MSFLSNPDGQRIESEETAGCQQNQDVALCGKSTEKVSYIKDCPYVFRDGPVFPEFLLIFFFFFVKPLGHSVKIPFEREKIFVCRDRFLSLQIQIFPSWFSVAPTRDLHPGHRLAVLMTEYRSIVHTRKTLCAIGLIKFGHLHCLLFVEFRGLIHCLCCEKSLGFFFKRLGSTPVSFWCHTKENKKSKIRKA